MTKEQAKEATFEVVRNSERLEEILTSIENRTKEGDVIDHEFLLNEAEALYLEEELKYTVQKKGSYDDIYTVSWR